MDFKKIIKDWFTGPDGETHDPARALWILGMVAFLAFSGYELWKTQKFDMVNFGIAYGGLLAAGAAGVKIKESTEPKVVAGAASAKIKEFPETKVAAKVEDFPKPPKG